MMRSLFRFSSEQILANSQKNQINIKRSRIFRNVIVLIFLSLIVSGCSSSVSETKIIESLTINSGNLQINKNEYSSLELTSNLSSSRELNKVKCTSSNEEVAAVVNNKIFGLSHGVASISCYIGDIISNSINATVLDESILIIDNENDPDVELTPPPSPDPVTPDTPPTSTPPKEPPSPKPTPDPPIDPVTPKPIPTPNPPPSTGKLLVVSYIDVGQGDSILIQTPNGSNILIDAGKSSYETKIANYLKAQGVTKIDVLIATHPHADHIGGMSYIVENFEIGSIYMPRATTTTQTFETLLTTIKDKGLLINTAKAGVKINIDNALKVEIIGPVSSTYSDLNQYSTVIKITYQDISFLFMGDAGLTSESEILNSGIDLDVDVIKIGHHGSSTSSSQSFLDAVSPKYAVICVGQNSYGHPTEQVINRLQNLGINILRTDQDGNIVISSDGKNIFIE